MTTGVLARRTDAAVTHIRHKTTQAARQIWTALPDYSDEGLLLWLDQIVPLITASQQTISLLTDLYISEVLSEMSGQKIDPIGIPPGTVSGAGVRNGTPPEVEYERPFKEIWFQLTQDKDFASAVSLGEQRAMSMISTDIQLARTNTARIALSTSGPKVGVVGYRRVITSAKACELCTTASTQRYHVNDLMPIHNNCSCGVAPIEGSKDPGQKINSGFLHPDAVATDSTTHGVSYYGSSGSVTIPQVSVRQHGEIGPVLTVKGQAFRGPSDVPPTAETAA